MKSASSAIKVTIKCQVQSPGFFRGKLNCQLIGFTIVFHGYAEATGEV